MTNYSVLMSVYYKEKPEYLQESMESMFSQTVPTNDFVLVCDGELTEELNAVIDEFKAKYGEILNVVRLEKNGGLGNALNIGIKQCKNELVARMDSDDISMPERCEKELAVFDNNPDLSIVGSAINEFSVSPDKPESMRCVPEKNKDIIRFAKKRSPFNHPSVMYKKSDVIRCGNYRDIRYMQDYYLWTAMLINGCKGYNIQEPLVNMRADRSLFKRRSGKLYRKILINLLKYMKDSGFISYPEYLSSCMIRTLSSVVPNQVRRLLYRSFLRKSTDTPVGSSK